jgi:putative membrane protein
MTALIFRWLVTTLALLIVSYLPGFTVTSLPALFLAALVLGLLNALVRPILFWLTLPLTILTLGLFLLVLNALMLLLTAWLVDGYEISGFLPALIGAILVSLISGISSALGGGKKRRAKERRR